MKQHLPSTATEADKQTLRVFIKTTKDRHARDRARAVLKRMEGYSRKRIAQFFDINKDTVSNWITWYRTRGLSGLTSHWKGGNRHKLTPHQKREVKRIVKTNTPKDLGYEKEFWDVPLLARYIRETYRVQYRSDRSYHRLFAFIGFTYHKPVKQHQKRSEKAVQRFERDLRKKGAYIARILSSSSKTK